MPDAEVEDHMMKATEGAPRLKVFGDHTGAGVVHKSGWL
jgi:hypothetical protein